MSTIPPPFPFTPEQQALEALADLAMAQADTIFAAREEDIILAVEGAASYEEAQERLLELLPDLVDSSQLADVLGRALLAADLHGRNKD